MPKKKGPATSAAAELRSRAEKLAARRQRDAGGPLPEDELRRAVHELEVHQIELQLQNEELLVTRSQLETALQRYTELFDFAPIGYARVTGHGTIVELNHAGARILGHPRGKLIGKPMGSLFTPQTRSDLRDVIIHVAGGGASSEAEMRLAEEPKTRFLFHAALMPGDEGAVLLAFYDVTERLNRVERLARSESDLREAHRRKDEFLAAVSHELRNPLAAIRSAVQLQSSVEPGGRVAQRAQAVIDRQATLLAQLTDDLLDVSRITRGHIRVERQPLDLSVLVPEVLASHEALLAASGLVLERALSADPLWILGDSARVQQILSNILTNAEKFTPRGGKVLVKLEREGEHAILHVRDDGVGIDLEVVPHVFEPFTQAPETAARSRGGLGLALVKELVELHGGEVDLESAGLGLGTDVRVRLPLLADPEEIAAKPARVQRRRVLVIDDDVDLASALCGLLEVEGHEVRIAHDGPSGIALARDWLPDIAICDIGLPGPDGYAVARAFRGDARLSGVHLIALTGYVRNEDAQKSREAGYEWYIAKPPSLEAIDQVFEEVATSPAGRRPS